MTDDELKQQLKEILIERLFLSISPEEIESDKNLMDNYGVDSVSVMEMAVGIEEAFAVSFADGDFNLAHFQTIDSMAAYIRSKQG